MAAKFERLVQSRFVRISLDKSILLDEYHRLGQSEFAIESMRALPDSYWSRTVESLAVARNIENRKTLALTPRNLAGLHSSVDFTVPACPPEVKNRSRSSWFRSSSNLAPLLSQPSPTRDAQQSSSWDRRSDKFRLRV